MNFRTQYNYVQEKPAPPSEPSQTVPDMSMSVREIFLNFAQGRPVDRSTNLVYTEDRYAPDLRTMDLFDQHNLMEQTQMTIDELQAKYEKEHKLKPHKDKPVEDADVIEDEGRTQDEPRTK